MKEYQKTQKHKDFVRDLKKAVIDGLNNTKHPPSIISKEMAQRLGLKRWAGKNS